jgi:hypothetical protein
MINYNRIAEAISYYEKMCHYTLMDVPWFVTTESIEITKPPRARYFNTFAGHLVGSGEQSFLDIRHLLTPNKRYVCATPCFRDEPVHDSLHLQCFFKVELMHVLPVDEKSALENMIVEAQTFFDRMARRNSPFIDPKIDLVATDEGIDINLNGVEIGSYGVREHNKFVWVYGTAVAEPRFSMALEGGPQPF